MWQRGVRLGVDVGKVRIGVARCDPDGILATPLSTINRDNSGTKDVPADMVELARLVAEHDSVEVVLGLPVNLAGQEGPAAVHVREYAQRLAEVITPVPVVLTDERMSTVVASRRLSERGMRAKKQRTVIDQMAAVEILQHWLDAKRAR
ncbi:Holliday junction resolvase RuvX [Allorhizocola rhizosphaerae]|uniref:Holliday junction resolvase RuvX n=1 Tax=Allorhizocola rhizosphaerae TaxID=1872709 RepID=UPI001FE51F1D|nr:Holliday junction resolvase RuvX [Allorhizocola rhizosphaerae]